MPKLAGFSSLASLPLEQVTEKISHRIADEGRYVLDALVLLVDPRRLGLMVNATHATL